MVGDETTSTTTGDETSSATSGEEPSSTDSGQETTSTAAGDESTSTGTYDLTCVDCGFETTVEGSVEEVLEVADAHQEKHGDIPTEHFVNFTRRDT